MDRICALIESVALHYRLPPSYLARLIWKESRFDVSAVSPMGAQGIAQFMPETARLEGLEDPFDPGEAIPAAARHLSKLRHEFGNLGLAAAAYNAGSRRVDGWLAGRHALPAETVDYVLSITARPAAWFLRTEREVPHRPLAAGRGFAEACRELPIVATRAAPRRTPPWGVQIATGPSLEAASRNFRTLAQRLPRIIAGAQPVVVRSRSGRMYSARVGARSSAEASRLCLQIVNSGLRCQVLRNR